VQTKVFLLKGLKCYSNESLQHYTSNLLSSYLRNDVLASRLHAFCLPNTPQLTS